MAFWQGFDCSRSLGALVRVLHVPRGVPDAVILTFLNRQINDIGCPCREQFAPRQIHQGKLPAKPAQSPLLSATRTV
jgi:hypothetical protein